MSEKLSGTPRSVLKQLGQAVTRFEGKTLVITEAPAATIVMLQSLSRKTIVDRLPFEAPESSGRFQLHRSFVQGVGEFRSNVLCVQPDQWLLISDDRCTRQLLASVRDLESENLAVTSVISDAFARIRISGDGARWLLSKLGGFDYHSSDLAPGFCTRTRLGKVATLVLFRTDEDGEKFFDVLIDRSLARYLWELLCSSAAHADELTIQQGD